MTERRKSGDNRDRGATHLEPVVWTESDEALAARAADPAAMTELYCRYVHRVDRYCRRQLQDADLAEDVTSQVFVKALEGLRRNQIENVASWIFSIAHNEVVTLYRRQRTDVGLELAEGVMSPDISLENAVIAQSDVRDLRDLLPLLTTDQRRVIELRLAGLTSLEIRQVLGKSRSWVGTTQYRAVHRLRELMEARPQEER